MGTQSTMFGPAKYSILPQQLEEDELVAETPLLRWVLLAILTGTILAGIVIKYFPYQIGIVTVGIAIRIFAASAIPLAPATV